MAKTPRSEAKQKSDQLRNIRRRFEREAARFEKRAGSAKGRERQNLLRAAEKSRETAKEYYVDNIRGKAKIGTKQYTDRITGAVSKGQSKSMLALEREQRGLVARKTAVARALLRGNTGSQFYAATKQIWNKEEIPANSNARNEAIIEGFKASRAVIEKQDFAVNENGELKYDFENLTLLDIIDIMSEMTGQDFSQNKDDFKQGIQYQVNSRLGLLRVGQMVMPNV